MSKDRFISRPQVHESDVWLHKSRPSGLDWSAPWYEPWRGWGESVAAAVEQGLALHEALGHQPAAPLRFVDASCVPAGTAYECYIFESESCPVRAGLHDFFNGICWLGMPRAKRQLNQLQATQIEALGVGSRRGPVRDAITLFDENGALLQAPPPLWEALRARQWRRLFVDLRPLWGQTRLAVFGHALLEKLAVPRKDLTAHVWCADAPLQTLAAADEWLAAQLTPERLASKPFTPLPVLGLPGWCAQNQDISFYDDASVFRTPRSGDGKTR